MKQTLQLKNYAIRVEADWADFDLFLAEKGPSQVVLICDHNVFDDCLPIFQKKSTAKIRSIIQIEPGEKSKNLKTLDWLWQQFSALNLDRNALVILLGGGVIGDLGGFAAACWKRGIGFVQVPTTLLSMVDSSIGGKTGIDFGGAKNVVGAFCDPEAVFIFPEFLATLPERELRSGLAEMLKHALIADLEAWLFFKNEIEKGTWREAAIEKILPSLEVKKRIVEADPIEKGERAALNIGHTIGHALEAFFLEKSGAEKLLHGEAVALGMIAESWISMRKTGLGEREFLEIKAVLSSLFGSKKIEKSAFSDLLQLMRQDKKNDGSTIRMALLDGQIGRFQVGCEVSESEILAALEACF